MELKLVQGRKQLSGGLQCCMNFKQLSHNEKIKSEKKIN